MTQLEEAVTKNNDFNGAPLEAGQKRDLILENSQLSRNDGELCNPPGPELRTECEPPKNC